MPFRCWKTTSDHRRAALTLFDLDHTLLPIDSDYAWGEFTQAHRLDRPGRLPRRNDEFYAHYQAGTLDVHDYVRFATEAIRLPAAPQAAGAAHERFMREVIAPAIRPQALRAAAPPPGRRRPRAHRHRHQRIRHRARSRSAGRATS